MAMRGEAGRALGISLICSAIGGLISALLMFLLTQPMMAMALKFSAAEQFSVAFLALSILVFLDQKRMLNTFASAIIGLWLATIGLDDFSTVPRFTFGIPVCWMAWTRCPHAGHVRGRRSLQRDQEAFRPQRLYAGKQSQAQ
jgi:TctA family transporter